MRARVRYTGARSQIENTDPERQSKLYISYDKLRVRRRPTTNTAAESEGVAWNNGWRTADGKFASPQGAGLSGASAENAVWDAVEAKPGWQVIRGRVSVRDASGQLRVYDGAAVSPSGRVIGLEVKSGSASLTADQRAFDSALNASGPQTVTGVGQNAGLPVRRAVEIRQP